MRNYNEFAKKTCRRKPLSGFGFRSAAATRTDVPRQEGERDKSKHVRERHSSAFEPHEQGQPGKKSRRRTRAEGGGGDATAAAGGSNGPDHCYTRDACAYSLCFLTHRKLRDAYVCGRGGTSYARGCRHGTTASVAFVAEMCACCGLGLGLGGGSM